MFGFLEFSENCVTALCFMNSLLNIELLDFRVSELSQIMNSLLNLLKNKTKSQIPRFSDFEASLINSSTFENCKP